MWSVSCCIAVLRPSTRLRLPEPQLPPQASFGVGCHFPWIRSSLEPVEWVKYWRGCLDSVTWREDSVANGLLIVTSQRIEFEGYMNGSPQKRSESSTLSTVMRICETGQFKNYARVSEEGLWMDWMSHTYREVDTSRYVGNLCYIVQMFTRAYPKPVRYFLFSGRTFTLFQCGQNTPPRRIKSLRISIASWSENRMVRPNSR